MLKTEITGVKVCFTILKEDGSELQTEVEFKALPGIPLKVDYSHDRPIQNVYGHDVSNFGTTVGFIKDPYKPETFTLSVSRIQHPEPVD